MNYSPTPPPIKGTKSLKPTVFWRIAEDIPRSLNLLLLSLSVIIPFVTWWLISNYGGVEDIFLPSPTDVGIAFVRLWEKGFLIKDTFASFFRVGIGFIFIVIVAAPLGIAMGTFPSIRALFEPIIGIIRYMPAPAFIPLLIIYLDINEESKIALIYLPYKLNKCLLVID